jgi:hypothetical protein
MRSAVNQAKGAYGTTNDTANSEMGNANQIGSSLIPGLEREANTPEGFTPEQTNNMLVASEQGAGGANSGLAGAAAARLARTRNSAGYSGALDAAARDKTQTLSNNALDIQNQSAKLGLQRQSQAQSELGGLYGTDTNAGLKAESLLPEDVNAEANASKTGWFQNMTQLIAALNPGGKVKGMSFGGG